jgi:hypothetical protein
VLLVAVRRPGTREGKDANRPPLWVIRVGALSFFRSGMKDEGSANGGRSRENQSHILLAPNSSLLSPAISPTTQKTHKFGTVSHDK